MDTVRDVCSATLSVRKANQLRVRLPLRRVTVAVPDGAEAVARFADVIADEVNVRQVEFTTDVAAVADEQLKLVPAKLGPRLGGQVQDVIRAHKSGDWSVDGDRVVVGGVELLDGEYTVEMVAADGTASAALGRGAGVVALDIEVDDDLEREGRARDLIRFVQQARRDAGLDVSDRITLEVVGGEQWIDAATAHRDLLARETLALEVVATIAGDGQPDEPRITVTRAAR